MYNDTKEIMDFIKEEVELCPLAVKKAKKEA